MTREELPHSIATRVSEWSGPASAAEIIVERDSQKGIVIGKKGAVLKEVGIRVRRQLPLAPSSSCTSRSTRTAVQGAVVERLATELANPVLLVGTSPLGRLRTNRTRGGRVSGSGPVSGTVPTWTFEPRPPKRMPIHVAG